jgi:hypothetical protein
VLDNLELHQAPGRKPDHLAQQVGVRKAARTDLCGGRSAMSVLTATPSSQAMPGNDALSDSE